MLDFLLTALFMRAWSWFSVLSSILALRSMFSRSSSEYLYGAELRNSLGMSSRSFRHVVKAWTGVAIKVGGGAYLPERWLKNSCIMGESSLVLGSATPSVAISLYHVPSSSL